MSEDVVAIEQLLYRYCHAVDRGTADEVAALFHENAKLIPVYSGEGPSAGRSAIREWYAKYHRKKLSPQGRAPSPPRRQPGNQGLRE